MEHPTSRSCADCAKDISAAHFNAQRCDGCRAYRRATHRTKYEYVCAHCETSFRTETKGQRFCTYRCRGAADRLQVTERQCIVCDRSYQRRSALVCSRACEQWERRYRGLGLKPSRSCASCGERLSGVPGNRLVKYCGRKCAIAAASAIRRGDRQPLVRQLACLACGSKIDQTRPISARYCDHRCFDRAARHIRRARQRGGPSEQFSPLAIFERDGWICHICNKPIDRHLKGRQPMVASLDHLIPVSHPLFPGHLASNVAAAHLSCNIAKRDRVTVEDVELHRQLANLPCAILASTVIGGRQVTCRRGHLFDERNTRVRTDGRRACRRCDQDGQNRRRREARVSS